MSVSVLIEPRDPLIFRDGKPFTAGLGARTVEWPPPSAVIGSIRTQLGRETGFDDPKTIERLRAIRQTGPFLACRNEAGDWSLAFPAPADAAVYDERVGKGDDNEPAQDDMKRQLELTPLRPMVDWPGAGEGMNLPHEMKPLMGARPQKPSQRTPSFWCQRFMMEWLLHDSNEPLMRRPGEIGYPALMRQRRMHVQMEETRRNGREGMLFATESLEFEQKVGERLERRAIVSRLSGDLDGWSKLPGMAPIGGESRLARWSEVDDLLEAAPDWLADQKLIRLQLVTPARFDKGWKPAWVESGRPPGTEGLELKLVAASVRRAVPISGWDYQTRGPKATHLLAPAGSVYFFQVENGDPRQLWLRAISDDEQARRDGFGIVLCGGWKWR